MRRRAQYFDKKEVLRNVRSPTVTEIPFRPRDRTTANVFLKCPSVTRTRIIFKFRVRSHEFGVKDLNEMLRTPNYLLRTDSNQSFVGEAPITLSCQDDMVINLNPQKPARLD